MSSRPRTDAKLKRLSWDEQLELWHLRFPVDPDQKALTQGELRVEIPLRHGFTVAASTLSDWERWFELELDFREASEQADQFAEQLLANPDIDPDKVKKAAQIIFTSRSIKQNDGALFTRLAELDLRKEKQELERDRLTAASRTKIEAGLDALFEEIKGNENAERLFAKLKKEVAKG